MSHVPMHEPGNEANVLLTQSSIDQILDKLTSFPVLSWEQVPVSSMQVGLRGDSGLIGTHNSVAAKLLSWVAVPTRFNKEGALH